MVSDVPGPPEQLADAASPFLYLFLIISLRIRHVLEDAPPCAVIYVEIETRVNIEFLIRSQGFSQTFG